MGQGKEGTIAYEQWKCTQNCQINHNGSSGSSVTKYIIQNILEMGIQLLSPSL